MAGKWMTLNEAVAFVAKHSDEAAAAFDILNCLRRGELQATAEHFESFFVWYRKPFNGLDGRYRAEKNADHRMIPIGSDWWDTCKLDWKNNTAHVPWNRQDLERVGGEQPFQEMVSGVLLQATDVKNLWQDGGDRSSKTSSHRPKGTGMEKMDSPLVAHMQMLIRNRKAASPTAAAKMVLDKASKVPGASYDSAVKRLVKRYKEGTQQNAE